MDNKCLLWLYPVGLCTKYNYCRPALKSSIAMGKRVYELSAVRPLKFRVKSVHASSAVVYDLSAMRQQRSVFVGFYFHGFYRNPVLVEKTTTFSPEKRAPSLFCVGSVKV